MLLFNSTFAIRRRHLVHSFQRCLLLQRGGTFPGIMVTTRSSTAAGKLAGAKRLRAEALGRDSSNTPRSRKRGGRAARTRASRPTNKKRQESNAVSALKSNKEKIVRTTGSDDASGKIAQRQEEEEYEETVCSVPKGRVTDGTLKIISWNVASLRSALKNGTLERYVAEEDPDVLCLQETKLKQEDTEGIAVGGYLSYWNCSKARKGYSGTAIFIRAEPLSVRYGIGEAAGDLEGRAITIEMDKFFIVNVYVPNSGAKLVRLGYRVDKWQPAMVNYIRDLEKSKPVILCGDLNCAHREIDIHAPKRNLRNAGFTIEERTAFDEMLREGFVDTFRSLYPKKRAYTYWSMRLKAREGNKGWRLDYFVVSRELISLVNDSFIRYEVRGSDHAPVGLLVNVS